MAALSAAKEAKKTPGEQKLHKVKGSSTIWKGALVMAATANGYAIPGADTASCVFLGVAYETKANAGADGAASVLVEKYGEYEFNATGTATQAWVGQQVYLVDDQTVALAATTTNDVLAGVCTEFISSTVVRVRIDGAAR
jgi:hypothetical protein